MERKELTRMSYVITALISATIGVVVMRLMFAASAADRHHGSK